MRYDQIIDSKDSLPIKMILMAESGDGKTGSIAALANAGWKVRILDFDNGTKILRQYLTPEGAKRVHVKVLTDKLKSTLNGAAIPDGVPTAFAQAMRLMNNWEDDNETLGSIESWDDSTILVIDSLSFLARAAMRFSMYLNIAGMDAKEEIKLARWLHPFQSDYGEAQNRVENVVARLYSSSVKCNVIVNAHIKKIGRGGVQIVKDKNTGQSYMREIDSEVEGVGRPVIVGKALSPIIGRYFNTMLMIKSSGSGSAVRLHIHTVTTDNTPLKNEMPNELPSTILIDGGNVNTGLDKVFKVLKGAPK